MPYALSHVVWFAVVAMHLLGCATVFPQTDDLKMIHTTYRQEFISAALPDAKSISPDTQKPAGLRQGSFAQTLAAIADYRRQYPDATQELSHLAVLEGMIYLQSRQFGLARLAVNNVTEAGRKLSTSSSAPRDSLFAEVFQDLVDGWEVIARHETGTPNINDNARENGDKLAAAADAITGKLCAVKKAGRLRSVEGDQGASYVATTGAIFYFWADHTASYRCNVPPKDQAVCTAFVHPATYLDRGRNLIWTFLPLHVQQALQAGTLADTNAGVEGELRFVEYYRAIQQGIEKRAAKYPEFPASPSQDSCIE